MFSVLVHLLDERPSQVSPFWTGKEIPNRFIVGIEEVVELAVELAIVRTILLKDESFEKTRLYAQGAT